MTKFKSLGLSWPPRGWESLGHIEHTKFEAVKKEPATACVLGATYKIEIFPFRRKDNRLTVLYDIEINGWEFNIYNESREYQFLSIMLTDLPHKLAPKEYYSSSIKTMLQPMRITQRSVERSIIAAASMMRQIEKGIVPECEKILKLYKIHPSQRSLYDFDFARGDSLQCGLPEVKIFNGKDELT